MAEITLQDLLAWEPRLRLASARAGTGSAGEQTDRDLTWAVAARATAPMLPPLRGGELVLLAHRILAESGVAFGPLLRELAGHGAAGVVLEAEAVPPGLRAVGAPLPLLVLPVGPMTPDLEGDLNRLLTQKRGELYRAGTEIGRVLAGLTTAGADAGQILAATADALGAAAEVVDARGLVLAASDDRGGGAAGLGPGPAGTVIPLAGGESLRLGPVAPEQRALARLVGERVAVAAEAALARAAQARPRGPARAEALADFLFGAGPRSAAENGTRAAALGLSAEATYRVALSTPELGAAKVQRLLSPYGALLDAGSVGDLAAAVIELRGRDQMHPRAGPGAARPTRGAADGAAEREGWLALSGPVVGAPSLPAAARQARFAAALLATGNLTGPVVRFDAVSDMGAFGLLYSLWGRSELTTFAADVLGDLPARDRRGQLRRTLLVYLETGGSHIEAAARLGIHRNTLAYRLKQIASLTNRDPADASTRLTLHLALVAAALPPVVE
jgi:purine catabolism regulator